MTVGRVANKVRVEGAYFYVKKYRSSDALPAPEIFFGIFCTASTKISFLPYFQTLQIIKYGPLKFFPHIPLKNIHFYVPENEIIQINFLDSLAGFLVLSHIYVICLITIT